ncbi:hypothetical protein ACJMK2_013562 [Sinanodonta woodiana]|uniref:Trafficking protein particle complex subunit n=1 Tax=Sinanodonta woodiana TaxID=1069815 RepID=A0ABD3V0E4_SINWO
MYNLVILRERVLMQFCCDVNRLYTSVFGALTGSENFHELMRLQTAIKVIMNHIYYDKKSKRFVHLSCGNHPVFSEYSKLVKYAIVSGSYSEMAHIFALLAGISKLIRSNAPQLHVEFASKSFNCKLFERQ